MPPLMSDHRQSLALATAALTEIISRAQAMQAAVIRGADVAEVEELRQAGMAVAEVYFDHSHAAAKATRAILADHPDADSIADDVAKRILD